MTSLITEEKAVDDFYLEFSKYLNLQAWEGVTRKLSVGKGSGGADQQVTEHGPMCPQMAMKTNSILAFITYSGASKTMAVTVPLYWVLVRPHPESEFSFRLLTARKTLRCSRMFKEEQGCW